VTVTPAHSFRISLRLAFLCSAPLDSAAKITEIIDFDGNGAGSEDRRARRSGDEP